jgi:hypothetical protein
MGLILDSSVLINHYRAAGAERTADARLYRPHSRKYRHRHLRRCQSCGSSRGNLQSLNVPGTSVSYSAVRFVRRHLRIIIYSGIWLPQGEPK